MGGGSCHCGLFELPSRESAVSVCRVKITTNTNHGSEANFYFNDSLRPPLKEPPRGDDPQMKPANVAKCIS